MDSEINKNLTNIFKDMSDMYLYLGGDERFRAIAYNKAAKVIAALPQDISVYFQNDSLKKLPGIGESIAEKIEEYIDTGKVKKYELLKKSVPYELMDLINVKGFGPRTLKQIQDELNISSKEEFINALRNGTITKVKGFGQKKVDNMLRALKLYKILEDRMLLWDALEAGEKLVEWLKQHDGVKQIELAGSLRRKKETIGDIDILVSCEKKNRKKIISYFIEASIVKQVLVKGDTKASIILKDSGRQVDLRIVNEDEWGAALQYFTGSKEHNIHLRTIAKQRGYKISEYGIFNSKNEKRIASVTEEDIYNTLGFQVMPPEMREDRGEIELAERKKIPKLVSLKDIKGDLHMHSNWSDGVNTIEEIAKYIRKNFMYEYIALTDHSKSEHIAHGMDEKQFLKQIKAIDEVNKKLGINFVKKGIEVDILTDGKLDISDEVLSQLDWVTASIHSNFNRDNTDRIIRACENPFVCCIGHPTGRLIGSREPYKLDMKKVVEAAKKTGTAFEINSQPTRMDLNDELTMLVREEGIPLVITTDSHSLRNFDYMTLGVSIARRAWCTSTEIINTMKWTEIGKWIQKKRKKKILNM